MNNERVLTKRGMLGHMAVIGMLALLLYALLYYLLQIEDNSHQPYYWPPDADSYLNAAKNLYASGKLDISRPYGYPLLTGLPTLFGLENKTEQFSHLLNVGFWLASICTIYLCVYNLLNTKRIALCSAFLFMAIVGLSAINSRILTEPACNFFILLSGYQLARFYLKNNGRYLVYAIFSLGAGALIKPILYPFTIIAAVFCFFLFMVRRERLHAALVLILLLFFAVQIIGNGLQHGSYKFSSIGGYTYYNYLGAYAEVTSCTLNLNEDARRWEAAREKRLHNTPKLENGATNRDLYDSRIREDLYFQLTENTWPLIYSYTRNIASNATSPSGFVCNLQNLDNNPVFEPLKRMLCVVSRLQNSILSITGLLSLLAIFFVKKTGQEFKPVFRWLTASGVITAYFILVTGISFAQGDRLHLPIFGVTFIQLVLISRLVFSSKKTTATW